MSIDYIRYDLLVQDALRSVVRKVVSEAARSGLPGDHHFNIAFKTQAPGVVIPPAMRQRYPDEMAIILQHEFWDLEVTADAIEVSLNFSRRPERLTIPFDSITGFSDPSVPFGFKLEPRTAAESAPAKSASSEREAEKEDEVQPAARGRVGDQAEPTGERAEIRRKRRQETGQPARGRGQGCLDRRVPQEIA